MVTNHSNSSTWLAVAIVSIAIYRILIAIMLEATRSITSLQRRLLLEEDIIKDPMLARMLTRPRTLNLGLALWNQSLLFLLISLVWSMQTTISCNGSILAIGTLIYIWSLDLLLPTLLTTGNPSVWIERLFPAYKVVYPILTPIIIPLAKWVEHQWDHQDTSREERSEEVNDEGVTALLEEGEAEGILEEGDRELIRNVVEFGDTVVREVMTPRTLVQSISISATVEDAWKAFRNGRHSRMPVYSDPIDNIVGVLLLKDLMQLSSNTSLTLEKIMKPVCFVPESKHILQLLRELQRTGNQLAMVVDEYGSLSGLISMEDLLEEVFGEIRDEHEVQADIQELSKMEFLVCGHVHVDDLEERIGLACRRDGFDTLAGLIMATLGHVPTTQETLKIPGAHLTVYQMEGMRILQVHIKLVDLAK